jgi:hypothetical protein
MEVKSALKDQRFRDQLPLEINADLQKYLQNPSCACNLGFYKKLLSEHKGLLEKYYPGRKVADLEEETKKLAENHFSVINCSTSELEEKLRKLPNGRKQIAIARYEDTVTVVINELDLVY